MGEGRDRLGRWSVGWVSRGVRGRLLASWYKVKAAAEKVSNRAAYPLELLLNPARQEIL